VIEALTKLGVLFNNEFKFKHALFYHKILANNFCRLQIVTNY